MFRIGSTQNYKSIWRDAWLLAAMVVAGCSGSAGSSNSGGTSTPPFKTATSATILVADAGAVCETLVKGAIYSGTQPTLVCNQGADLYTAYLDGSKSTSSAGALTYAWAFVSKPAGSTVALANADTVNPTFVPDVAGRYIVQLVVSANGASSPRAVGLVVALDDATLNPILAVNPGATPYPFHGGLASDCIQCHSAASADPAIRGKPSTHIASSDTCQSCHSPLGFNATSFVDHTEVFGACSSCHDGVIAVGKSAGHLVTTQECSDCHTTDHFLKLNPDGTFDHTGITRVCSSCHNGTVAIGTDSDPSPSGHPSISVECNACHTTATFKAPFLNHSDTKVVVPGTCGQAGCHDGLSVQSNGVPITGKNSAPHPHPLTGDITKACDVCHSTTTYNLGGVFDHGILARHPIACKSCHDGLSAIGKTPTHIATPLTSDCGDCHHTSTFVGGFVDHKSPAVTGAVGGCVSCHNNTAAVGVPTAPAFSPVLVAIHTAAAAQSCGACHTAGGSFALATIDHSGFGTVGNITLPPAYPTCSGCHDDSIATGKSTGHLTTTQDCGMCHSPLRGDWFGATFDHSVNVAIINKASTPTCTSCHNGTAATGKSLTHVPLPTAGQDCLVCHGTSYSSFELPTFDHASPQPPITSNCASCHDGKAHDGVTVITKPTGHIPTTVDCSKCHADTANGPGINGTIRSGFRTATPFVETLHPAYTTGCRTCHITTYNKAPYNATSPTTPLSTTHATANSKGWDCNACHTTRGNFKEVNPVNHQDPTIKAQACVICHAVGNTTGAIGKGATHPVTSNLCQQCHQAGGSFIAGFDHATLTGTNKGLACASCHDGTTATGKISNHVATSRDCAVCHAGYPPTASSFAGGTFSHSGPEMTGKLCTTCHTGNVAGALGKTPTHVVTNADCGACHTTTAFTPATSFNHTGVTTGCAASGCHASGTVGVVDVTDDPNPLPHIPIVVSGAEVNCYSCHKNSGGTFANATMNHSVVTSIACQTCHDGKHDGSNTANAVTGKTVGTTTVKGHFVTSVVACAACHASTTAWTVPVTFYKHLPNPPGYIPVSPAATGNHSTTKVPKCVTCHKDTKSGTILINGNANISTFPHATYASTCAACHASRGENEHGKPLTPKFQNCGASGCHKISSNSF